MSSVDIALTRKGGRMTDKLSDATAPQRHSHPRAGKPSSGTPRSRDWLRVTAGGAKSFVLDYRVNGRQRRITLGNYPDWTVQAARAAAKDDEAGSRPGSDPMGERQALRDAPTVQDLWDRYQIEKLSSKARAPKSTSESMWQKIILPRLAKHRVAERQLSGYRRSCIATSRLIRGTPVRANRVVECLRGAFNLAIRWQWRQDNPCRRTSQSRREAQPLSRQDGVARACASAR